MVEDVPPYWIYLPRNLSYVGDQVWDYFKCCSRRKGKRMDLTVDCAPLEGPPCEGRPSSPKSPDSLDDSEHFEDIFNDFKLDSSRTDSVNGRSDYGSDLSSPVSLNGYNSDITITDDDVIPLIMSPDEDLDEPEYFHDHIINNVTTPTSDDVDLADTTDNHDLKTGPVIARANDCRKKHELDPLTIFSNKPNVDEQKLSFLDLLAPAAGYFDVEESEFPKPELRRSTSLKSNKTPPGTPGRKKVVRFADAFGLDLEHVRHVLNLDSPPRIPASAVADLKLGVEKDHVTEGNKYFHALFAQPGATGGFVQRVLAQRVSLENAMINNLTITGTVRVANISFHKTVTIRFTVNDWSTYSEVMTSYVQNSCDGATDRFSFTICSPTDIDVGCKLQFAICFSSQGQQFWDNNYGVNYVFECYARSMPTLSSDNSWLHFL